MCKLAGRDCRDNSIIASSLQYPNSGVLIMEWHMCVYVFTAVACVSLAAVTAARELGEAMLLHVLESSTFIKHTKF